MMQKLRNALTSFGDLRRRDDGGLTMVQLAGFIIGPIVLAMIAGAALSMMRLGGDLTTALTRDASMNQMVERMQLHLTNITDMDVADERAFTAHDQPSRRTAYYVPALNLPDTCITNTWALVDGDSGTRTLKNTQRTHEADACDSPVSDERTWELTGFADDTFFDYENAYGRDLTFASGSEAGPAMSSAERPEGLFDNEWDYPHPGFVTIDGTLNQVIGSTPVDVTSKTSMKQLRPGVVVSDLGELGPPIIERSERGGDTFRAQFTAVTQLTDPRAKIEWSYRDAFDKGATKESRPTEGQWSSWSDWSGQDYYDATVWQGSKWDVQARYRIILDAEVAESETVAMSWVRPVAKTTAPGVSIALVDGKLQARITTKPPACPTGPTKAQTQSRHFLNTAASSGWTSDDAAPYERIVSVGEGKRLTAAAQSRCASPYAEGPWAGSAANAVKVQPIITAPTVTAISGPITSDRGYTKATLAGCPVDTRYQARPRHMVNNASSWTFTHGADWKATSSAANFNTVGVRQGDRYAAGINIRCASDYTTGPGASRSTGYDVNPVRSAPRVTNPNAIISNGVGVAAADVNGCPAWLDYEARLKAQRNGAETWSYNSFTDATASRVRRESASSYPEGSRFRGGISARCVSPWSNGPAAEATDTGWDVRPIISTPKLTNPNAIILDTGATLERGRGAADMTGCVTGTTYEARVAYKHGAGTVWQYGEFKPSGAGRPTRDTGAGFYEGDRISGGISARCVSPYAIGPAVQAVKTSYGVRPITSKPSLTNPGHVISGDTGITAANVSGCPAGTAYQVRLARMVNAETSWTWGGFTDSSAGRPRLESSTTIHEGYRFRGGMGARCVSDWATGPDTSVSNSGHVIRPVTDTPSVTNPNSAISGSTARAAADVASCAAPLTYEARLVIRKNSASSFNYGSFSDASAGRQSRTSASQVLEGERVQGGISARCVGLYDVGNAVQAVESDWTLRAITTKPTLRDYRAFDYQYNGRFEGYIAQGCPSNTLTQVRFFGKHDYKATWQRATAWLNQNNGSAGAHVYWTGDGYGINEGARWIAGADIRCTTPYDEGAFNYFEGTHVSWIVSTPYSTPQIDLNQGNGNVSARIVGLGGCPAGTGAQWRLSNTGWVGAGDQGWRNVTTLAYGRSTSAAGQVRCTSDFYAGPVVDRYTSTVTRYTPAPSAPSNLHAPSGGATVTCDFSAGSARVSWNAASGASSYRVQIVWPNRDNQTRSVTQTTSGLTASHTATGGVASSFWMEFRVTAIGPGGSSGTTTVRVGRQGGCIRGD